MSARCECGHIDLDHRVIEYAGGAVAHVIQPGEQPQECRWMRTHCRFRFAHIPCGCLLFIEEELLLASGFEREGTTP